MSKPTLEPLRHKTMTLDELQRRVLKVIRQTRKHLRTPSWLGGMSDDEFIDTVLDELATAIEQDRFMLKQRKS